METRSTNFFKNILKHFLRKLKSKNNLLFLFQNLVKFNVY